MRIQVTYFILGASVWLAQRAVAQQQPTDSLSGEAPTTTIYQAYYKVLPHDLPQSKLLFIKFSRVNVPTKEELSKTMSKSNAGNTVYARENHNSKVESANRELVKAAAHYPFAYRITTEDSVAYYRAQGYKYKLFHDYFGSAAQAYSNHQNYSPAELYLKDLVKNDQYVFGSFSVSSGYNYSLLVGKLLSKVERQFKAKK